MSSNDRWITFMSKKLSLCIEHWWFHLTNLSLAKIQTRLLPVRSLSHGFSFCSKTDQYSWASVRQQRNNCPATKENSRTDLTLLSGPRPYSSSNLLFCCLCWVISAKNCHQVSFSTRVPGLKLILKYHTFETLISCHNIW